MQRDMAKLKKKKKKIEPFLPGGMTESSAGAGKIQDKPRTFLSREMLKRKGKKIAGWGQEGSKGHRTQPKRVSDGQSWNSLRSKVNNTSARL